MRRPGQPQTLVRSVRQPHRRGVDDPAPGQKPQTGPAHTRTGRMTAGFEPDTPPYPRIGTTPPGREWPRWVALLGAGLLVSTAIAAAVTWSQPASPRAPITVPGLATTVPVTGSTPTSPGDTHDDHQ